MLLVPIPGSRIHATCSGRIGQRIDTHCRDTDQEHRDIGQFFGAARPSWRHVPRPDAYDRPVWVSNRDPARHPEKTPEILAKLP